MFRCCAFNRMTVSTVLCGLRRLVRTGCIRRHLRGVPDIIGRFAGKQELAIYGTEGTDPHCYKREKLHGDLRGKATSASQSTQEMVTQLASSIGALNGSVKLKSGETRTTPRTPRTAASLAGKLARPKVRPTAPGPR